MGGECLDVVRPTRTPAKSLAIFFDGARARATCEKMKVLRLKKHDAPTRIFCTPGLLLFLLLCGSRPHLQNMVVRSVHVGGQH